MPFNAEVINAKLGEVNMPTLELYDGTTDLGEHLQGYKAQMYVQDVDDTPHCSNFPATVKGWHNPGSIA